MKKYYKTVILSDIHLGKPNNLSNKLLEFLEGCTIERMIFNGDAIDFWQLNTFGARKEKETRFVNYIININRKLSSCNIYQRKSGWIYETSLPYSCA
ncbi:MAG: hypothetical protein PHR61_04335 [Candidatus Absconditabacteria bacterium]|nr:hypothetical protein [Candidatus Absconditabacteria bacterium]